MFPPLITLRGARFQTKPPSSGLDRNGVRWLVELKDDEEEREEKGFGNGEIRDPKIGEGEQQWTRGEER